MSVLMSSLTETTILYIYNVSLRVKEGDTTNNGFYTFF